MKTRVAESHILARIAATLEQPAWHWSLAVLLAGFYLACNVYICIHRLLWYDEVFTAVVSRVRDVPAMWELLTNGGELTPILFFLTARASDTLFGHADFALRLPSAIGFTLGMLLVFDIVRRLTNGLHGLIAMSLVTTSFVAYYGYEARPYALCFLLSAAALWVWIFLESDAKAAVMLGLVFLTGVALHYYFMLCLAPFAVFALAERRIFHPRLLGAGAGSAIALAILYPQIARSHADIGVQFVAWAPPSVAALQSVYFEFFPVTAIPLAVVATGAAFFGIRPQARVPAMGAGERIGWLFLTIPIACFAGAVLVTHFFYNRYMISTVPGVVVALVCMFWRRHHEAAAFSLALLLLTCGIGIRQELLRVIYADRIQPASKLVPEDSPVFGGHQDRVRDMLKLESTLAREGKEHIAISENSLYLEAWYYSKHRERYVNLLPQPKWSFANYAQLNFWSLEEAAPHGKVTAVVKPDPEVIQGLERTGLRTRVRFSDPLYIIYLD